ncbi:protein ALTERED PHOSPHATE STARVATION RESPONSE 1-like isoform X2 [Phragmites australis]|uniref:protein ALTERED PHOSPHATE STARVATION RESPONSE 1-like isoform X2 n=1 Tax=Phragmites australis TaxID=29695 RepID=UPI002D7764AF|nr:protein ALTERED PHOSPHATE STARVATION RESPONSE 1-like isoform X2 [Phragmites australis]
MGSSVSKQDNQDTALQLCKGRLRHIEEAIAARYALSAAHLSYEQSLRNVGAALRQFVESHHDSNMEKSPDASYVLLSPEQPVDSANLPPSNSLTVTVNSSEASFRRKEQHISAFFPPPAPPPDLCALWDYFDPTYDMPNAASYVPEKLVGLEDWSHPNIRDNLPSSIGNTSEIVEVQEENRSHLDANKSMETIVPENSGSVSFRSWQDWIPPNERDLFSSIGNTSEIVEVEEELRTLGYKEVHGNNSHSNSHHIDCNSINMSDTHLPNSSFIPGVSKDLLSSVEEIEHQFIKAAESCHEVSRMLETRKIRLCISSRIIGKSSDALSTLLICCKARNIASHESEQHRTKVITWSRTLSSRSESSKNPHMSAQKDDDHPQSCCDFVEEFCLISGSHASSLDRLYAWERKLYDELKANKLLKKTYDKKCTQLQNQFAKDVSARQIDKTRATVKELYSQLMVRTEVLSSISKTIEKLRDEELQPQILELLDGFMRMWRMLQEVHHMQHTITSLSDECVMQPQDRSRRRKITLSPRQHLAPPMFVLLGDWYEGIASLHSEESCDPIKKLAADLRRMCRHAAEDGPARKKSSNNQAEDNTSLSVGEPEKFETESNTDIMQAGLIAMFDRLSKFSCAMASLSENIKREAEVACEAYRIGRLG